MPQSIEDQIDEMLKVTDEPSVTVSEEEPEPEPEEPKEEVKEDESAESEGDEEEGKGEEEVEEKVEETTEEKPEEIEEEPKPEEPELDRIKRENEELRKRVDDLSAPKEPEPKPEPKEEPKPEPKPEKLEIEEVDFLGGVDVDDLTRDPAELNKLLNKVYTQGIDSARKVLGENILRSLPEIVKNNVATVISLRKASEDFYEANEDLKPFKRVVSAVFEEVAANNPDKRMEEILEDVEKESRKRLELYKKAINPNQSPQEPKPRLPRKKSQPRQKSTKPDVTPIQNEIDQMNKTLSEV